MSIFESSDKHSQYECIELAKKQKYAVVYRC